MVYDEMDAVRFHIKNRLSRGGFPFAITPFVCITKNCLFFLWQR